MTVCKCGMRWETRDSTDDELLGLLNELHEENKEFKALLDKMSDCNNEIWLDDGRIYRLRKAFKGEWVK